MLLRLFVYVLITTYVFLPIYYLLTKIYFQSYSFVDRLLGTFILGVSQIIITGIILGFALQLVSLNLLLFNIVISTCVLMFAGVSYQEIRRQFKEVRSNVANLFNLIFKHKIISIIFILSVLQVAWWAFQTYLFPPYAWDALTYHLPKVAHILQSNGIEVFQASWIYINTYPFDTELLFLWNVIYLGNDLLVNGTQIAFALSAVLAIYGISRKVGVTPQNALYAMTFLFIPIVIQQATTCYIDIVLSSLFIIAANFVLLKDKPKINLVIMGLAVGIIIGSRYLLVLPGLIITLILFLLILLGQESEKQGKTNRFPLFRRFLKDSCLYFIPVLLIGGIWYIRNYILFSNPVAPIEVTLFGQTLFNGPVMPIDVAHNTPIFPHLPSIINAWLERNAPGWSHPFYVYDTGRGGFGPIFPILLLPSILFCLFIAYRKRLRRYLVISLLFILAFLVVPMNWWSRYTIFFCGFGVLSFTVIMEHLPSPKTIALMALPIIVLTFILGNAHPYFRPETVLDFVHRPLDARQSSDFPAFFEDEQELFAKILEKPGVTILYTDIPHQLSYPLWGSNFTNTVIYIPKHYVDYEEFINHIRKFGKSRIVTTDDSDIMRYYNAHRPKLQLVYQKDKWRIISYAGDDNVQKE